MDRGSTEVAEPWWRSGVVYQIYPRSFCDTDGDGVGDLEGIRRHLDHLTWLGVDALWLSPVYPSPMADFGYDVADYCDIDPLFGSLDTFDALVAEAHRRDLRVILDWVPNHTSDQHAWFREARSGPDAARRDWYVWRDPGPDGGPPNNWVAAFSPSPAWTLDEASGQYYLHLFLPEQPDLNWANPDVRSAMHDTLRFWLDRGVDGFRADVVHCIGKAPALDDDPPEYVPLPHCILNDRPETHPMLRDLRRLLDGYEGDRMMVGEVVLLDPALVASYYGRGDELQLAFNFAPLHTAWDATRWRDVLTRTQAELEPIGAWPTWVLSNHDNPRHRTRYGSTVRARAAAVLLLGLRGTPFLYAGEELGLEDAAVPADRVVDPGGRDGCRAPLPWDASEGHGWASLDPWLPWPPHSDRLDVASQREDPDSMLHLYRRLLAVRRGSPALVRGDQELLDLPEGVVGWRRRYRDDVRVVLVNFTAGDVAVPGVDGTVEVSSCPERRSTAAFDATLGGDEAVIVRAGP
jgi:alpha-glucosidase